MSTAEDSYRLAADLHRRAMDAAAGGNLVAAISLLEHATQAEPSSAAMLTNLGVLLSQAGRFHDAISSFVKALQLSPNEPAIYNNLANALSAAGDPDAAAAAAERSLALEPRQAEALNALGNALKEQGRLTAALAAFDRGAALRPELTQLASNRLYLAHFLDGMTAERLLAMHRQWAASVPKIDRISPPRRVLGRRDVLRIGYVSPDFRDHPVGRFVLPIIRGHQRSRFKVYCYSGVGAPDRFTSATASAADRWRVVNQLDDGELAQKIRADGIDILVDLSLHMRGNRLKTFAQKVAPVQVTYLGYCSTSGLDAIDYRLTDPFLDPLNAARDVLYAERSIRLPHSYWCYVPPLAPKVESLPLKNAGFVTFGCLNNFCKVTDHTLRLWRDILQSVQRANLILHAADGEHRQRVLDRLGVTADRVRFVSRMPHDQYLRLHQEIDIGLDPTPCTGGTTTCDALWMGVPVISLAGELAVARGGLSILSNIGLADLVADHDQKYVSIAVELASSVRRLSELRLTMRERMRASPLMNQPQFIRDLESAYLRMWNNS